VSFLGELRRRNVFKVGAAYTIVAWLLIQIADVVLPALQAPEWTVGFVTVQLILGFPIALLLAWAYEMTPEGIKAAGEVAASRTTTPATGDRLNYVILGLLVSAVGFLLVDQYVLEPRATAPDGSTASSTAAPSPRPVLRANLILGPTEPVADTGLSAHIAVSPDGRQLVYAAQSQGSISQLYHRYLDQFEARLIPGTEGAQYPFFSPDGEWVAFSTEATDPKLKKVSVRTGPPQPLADTSFSSGASWTTDDTIIFIGNVDGDGGSGLFRIPATGGTPELLMTAAHESSITWSEALPDGDAVLFVFRHLPDGRNGAARDGGIAVFSLETGERRNVIDGGYAPRYVPTGHILFARAGALWAVPFDVGRLETTGPEVPIVEGVEQDGVLGSGSYAVSDDGLLVYVPGYDTTADRIPGATRRLVWVDREGREQPLRAPPRAYEHPRVSPDARRLAVVINDGTNQDIWIYDLTRGTSNQLTFDAAADFSPLWTPDGEHVVFGSDRQTGGIYWKAADGTGQAEPLLTGQMDMWPSTFSPDNRFIFNRFSEETSWDFHLLSLLDDDASEPLIEIESAQIAPQISPDGRWIAYRSDELGSNEIFVQPFPDIERGKWLISSEGGEEVQWEPQGRELFYRNGEEMMVVAIETEPTFSAGIPRSLSMGIYAAPNYSTFHISPDGRFLSIKNAAQIDPVVSGVTQLNIVENWFMELERRSPSAE